MANFGQVISDQLTCLWHYFCIFYEPPFGKNNLGFSHVFSANLNYILSTILNKEIFYMYIGQISGLKQPKTLTQTI